MIYIISKSNKPQYNIALEEYCFKKLLNHEKVFMLWINEPTIVVGKHQNTLEEINAEYFKSIIDQDRCSVVICNLKHE